MTLSSSGHELDDTVRCPKCGWGPSPVLPAWVRNGAVFGLDGKTYRVLNHYGSTNRGTPENSHMQPYVTAELVDGEPWAGLPPAPCTKNELAASLAAFRRLPHFFVHELERALRTESP